MEPHLTDREFQGATITDGATEAAINLAARALWSASRDSLLRHIPPAIYASMDAEAVGHSALSVAVQALLQATQMQGVSATIHALGIACGSRLKGLAPENLAECIGAFADGLMSGHGLIAQADTPSGPMQ